MMKLKKCIAFMLVTAILFTNITAFAEYQIEIKDGEFIESDKEAYFIDDVVDATTDSELIRQRLDDTELIEDTSGFDNEISLMSLSDDSEDVKPEIGGPVKSSSKIKYEEGDGVGDADEFTEYPVSTMSLTSTDYEAISSPSFRNGVNHPHLGNRDANEYVSPFDGTLQLNYTDLHLPGRNGLDLNLNRIYKSEMSNIEASNSTGEYAVNNGTYYTNRYALGLGWAFGFPSVELREKYDGTKQAYYHDGTGAAYRSNYYDEDDGNDDNAHLWYYSHLDNYYVDNVEFDEEDHSYNRDGVYSQYSFKTADNTMQYFAEDGRLLAIKDRFDNEIKFDYEFIPGENLIPFDSYALYTLGGYWSHNNRYLTFNSGSYETGTEVKSQIVDLNEFYDDYYISLLYKMNSGITPFEGEFEVYCDLYDNSTLIESVQIADVTPTVYDENIKIEAEISLDDFDEKPNRARIRIKTKKSTYEILFADIRLSAKMPLISTITDTIGRTVNFQYVGDVYTRYEGSPNLPIYVTVYDSYGNYVNNLTYYRNTFYHRVENDYGEVVIYEQRYFYFWGCYNGLYTTWVDYEYFDGDGSTIRSYYLDGYYFEFEDRPIVNVADNLNSKTYFTYEKVKKWTDNRPRGSTAAATKTNTGFIDTWRVVEKYDINDSNSDVENEKYNIYQYNYTSGAHTDETCYYSKSDEGPGYINPKIGTYDVVVTNPNGRIDTYKYTSHTFDIDYKLRWEITLPLLDSKISTESSATGADYINVEYTYDDDYAITSPNIIKTTECTDGESRVYYNTIQYDDNSCLPTVTSLPLTSDEVDDPPAEKLITTTYQNLGNRMFVPNQVSYYQQLGGDELSEYYKYDYMGRLCGITDAEGNFTSYSYSRKYPWMISGKIIIDPEDTGDSDRVASVTYEYNDDYGIGPTSENIILVNGTYTVNTFVYEPKYGNIVESTVNGGTTTYEYDYNGRLTKVLYPNHMFSLDGVERTRCDTYEYVMSEKYENSYVTTVTKEVQVIREDYDQPKCEEQDVSRYDDSGNLLFVYSQGADEKYTYDSSGRVIGYLRQGNIYSDTETADTASYTYDGFDRITSVTDRLGNVHQADYKNLSTEYSFVANDSSDTENHIIQNYDMYGRMIAESVYPDGINGLPLTTQYTYDLVGNVLSITDANGKVTYAEYDRVNNPVKTTYADGTVVTNEYNKLGAVKETVQYDGIETYSTSNTYDNNGALLTRRQIGDKINTRAWNYEYNSDGYLSYETDPNGNNWEYSYDDCGNVISKRNGSYEHRYSYRYFGGLSNTASCENDVETGRREKLYWHLYEPLITVDVARGEGEYKERYCLMYDYKDFNPAYIKAIIPNNGPVEQDRIDYIMDDLYRTTAITVGDEQFSYEYYGDGLVKKLIYPNSDIYIEYTYDNTNQLKTLIVYNGDTVLRTYSYTYDNVGNITSISGSDNITYTYDDMYRLKSYTQDGVTTTYEYDSRNNIVSETRPGNIKLYEYGGDNRLYSVIENGVVTKYEYDLNGNIIKRGNDEFAYNQDNHMIYSDVNDVVTEYEIAPEGLRERKTTNGETVEYTTDLNGRVILENDEYIINGNTPLAVKRGDSYYYYICNAHGDVVMLLDEQGNVMNTYSYDPWGKITAQTETIDNNIKYAGEYYDDENGLIYLRNRYYDPNIRRFTSEDPARDGLNWYAYCENNPVNFVDPTGLVSTKDADEIIKNNAQFIIDAGDEFNVNPAILAACIYAEQIMNVNYTESAEDFAQAVLGLDCSVGISQVRISTAIRLENAGYIEKTYDSKKVTYLYTIPMMDKPVYATDEISRESNIFDKLLDDETNIRYAAAYLSMIQNIWKEKYPEIDGRTAILATLYNIGEYGGPKGVNSSPESNPFGQFAKEQYYHMMDLLGIK